VLVERALRLRFDWESVAGLDRPQQAERILAAARREGRLPEGYDAARLTRMIEVYPVNRAALLAHRPRPYAGPACLLATAGPESTCDPALGWAPLLPRLRVRTTPGDHYSLLDPPNAPGAARLIRSWLAGELG